MVAMPSDTVYGFWSYAHEDNKLDGGNILELARLIKEEYNLLSGEPLELFIDRDGIAWGEEWRKRIDSSLVQTTFFIPIITPRYFQRPECRRELLEFIAKAKDLGVEELVLPILYVETPGLSPDSPDQAVALVARTQYVDWRNARLMNTGSREYRSEVHILASRLLEIADHVASNQLGQGLDTGSGESEDEGIVDTVEKVNALLPEWLDAVIGDKFNSRQFDATQDEYNARIARLRKANSPASAILATQVRFAREMLPLAERYQRDARTYVARSIELDPLISRLTRLVSEHPENWSLVVPVREAIDEGIAAVQQADRDFVRGVQLFGSWFNERRHLGRIFQKCSSIMRNAEQLVSEGNSIVRRWNSELSRDPSLWSSRYLNSRVPLPAESPSEVRRARFGPGLWLGPRRQARRGGRGSARKGWVPKMLSAERFVRSGWRGSSGALTGGGADTDNARRSGSVSCAFVRRLAHLARYLTARPPRSATPGTLRWGTGGGRWRGRLCAAAAADVGPASEGHGETAAPQRRDSRQHRPPSSGSSKPLYSPRLLVPAWVAGLGQSSSARRRCALEAVEKLVADQDRDRCP
jgi:hypothetical protein